MPVKENSLTSENADLSAETERRRQQLQEENFKKSEKFLPFLNAKAENHMSRITINSKIRTKCLKWRSINCLCSKA